jgi:serine/threonine protein kinase
MEFMRANRWIDSFQKRPKLPIDTALRLSEELAEALDQAHGQDVVQRDMKPANILVTPDIPRSQISVLRK